MNPYEKKRKELEAILESLKNHENEEQSILGRLINHENMELYPILSDREKNKIYDWELDTDINPDFELWEKEFNE